MIKPRFFISCFKCRLISVTAPKLLLIHAWNITEHVFYSGFLFRRVPRETKSSTKVLETLLLKLPNQRYNPETSMSWPRWARSGQVADWTEQTRERQHWYPNRPGYCYWTWGPVTRDKSHWLVCSDGDFGTDPRYADGDAREYEGFLQRRAGVEWTSRRKLILDNLCWIARSMFKDSLSWEYCGTNQDKLKKNQETDKPISEDKSCTTVDFSWVIFWNTCKCTSIC